MSLVVLRGTRNFVARSSFLHSVSVHKCFYFRDSLSVIPCSFVPDVKENKREERRRKNERNRKNSDDKKRETTQNKKKSVWNVSYNYVRE